MSAELVVRRCERLEEFQTCVDLQRRIWGEADLEVEPVTMFVVASKVGGQVFGAFDGSRMVGYLLALPGVRNGKPYLHSHMTGVLEEYRDKGVGRKLKLYQREEALARGISLVEWTFDPLELRNAHFNLNRLGAIARQMFPNLYGVTTSPLHRGMPTDRLLAEWHLNSPRVAAILSGRVPEPAQAPAEIRVPLGLEPRESDEANLPAIQERLRREFQDWFGRGYAAVALVRSAQESRYLLTPWSDF
jgi:predicted GNAT superfamily acetyltransferase